MKANFPVGTVAEDIQEDFRANAASHVVAMATVARTSADIVSVVYIPRYKFQ